MRKIRFGFTLGEVLMTLGIVGVIAAMTMPVLVENVNESKYRSLLKSFYSKFSVDLDSILTTAGAAEGSSPCDSFDCFNDISADTFVSTNLFNAVPCTAGCSSVEIPAVNQPAGFNDGKVYTLANGMTMNVMPRIGGCGTGGNFTANYATNKTDRIQLDVCALVYVDVNGNKGPNNFKNDKFAFYILSSKDIKDVNNNNEIVTIDHRSSALLPLGLSSGRHGHYNAFLNNNDTCSDGNSPNCTAEILDGEGYWKRRDDCWDSNDWDKTPPVKTTTQECKNCQLGQSCFKN